MKCWAPVLKANNSFLRLFESDRSSGFYATPFQLTCGNVECIKLLDPVKEVDALLKTYSHHAAYICSLLKEVTCSDERWLDWIDRPGLFGLSRFGILMIFMLVFGSCCR